MLQHSYLSNADVDAIEHLYQSYKDQADSVDLSWRQFFEGYDLAIGRMGLSDASEPVSEDMKKEIKVLQLINDGYRKRGHFFTKTNPVRERRRYEPDLSIENYGLEKADLEKVFNAGVNIGIGPAKLKDIIAHLEQTYCQSIGVEYSYIPDPEKVQWLQTKMESQKNTPNFTLEQKRLILEMLNKAVVFENFLHTKYVGQKRFSLEGLECLIPALDSMVEYGASDGVEEFVVGMAHRGRLNVLCNILGKSYEEIFSEFEGKAYRDAIFEGDVKYHLGHSANKETSLQKKVRLTLCPNPSHLEAVAPVALGVARAKLDKRADKDNHKIVPIIIHGDAAVAGQGVVYETIQMAGLRAYSNGGSMHVVTNNQIGFTTNYVDGRTSIYCTDVAKTTKCPVFHVNADDVESVVYTVKLALEYRQKFKTDVFIDLLGYRKYGHNEGDEPKFTQPALYKIIAKHLNPREIYAQKLSQEGKIEADLAKNLEKEFKDLLQKSFEAVKDLPSVKSNSLPATTWSNVRKSKDSDFEVSVKTAITLKNLDRLFQKITQIPEGFTAFSKTKKLFDARAKMMETNAFDWAMGELLAYASLLDEGHPVRMSGQDVERGTFSHRHAIILDEKSLDTYCPLDHVSENADFQIYNSLLSEYAVLSFEYGYSSTQPNGLTIWEAQFGDFANGAQIAIDQYISSGEAKWNRYSGLTMLLPHGHEGQGPEHTSARPERFLQLCATNNMYVLNCTTPANFFHALRRQVKNEFRIPLVVLTPKSLLRHPKCVSAIEDFTQTNFKEVIEDSYSDLKTAKRVIFCTGKIYYDLLERQLQNERKDVAIVRVEQLYPLPEKQMEKIMAAAKKADFYWVQEEPKNQGYWTHILRYDLGRKLEVICRRSSSSPATGFAAVHAQEQESILQASFDL